MKRVIAFAVIALILSACGKPSPSASGLEISSSSAIIGGTSVSENDPFARSSVLLKQVLITRENDGYRLETLSNCSGVLVAKRLVVTAAHCLSDARSKDSRASLSSSEAIYVFFGPHWSDIAIRAGMSSDITSESPIRFADSTKTLMHPHYAGDDDFGLIRQTTQNDIGLVALNADAPVGFEPAKILLEPSAIDLGTHVTAVGYGQTNGDGLAEDRELRAVPMTVSGFDPELRQVTLFAPRLHGVIAGDSGGASFVDYQGESYVWSVHSISGRSNDGAGSADEILAHHLDFIKNGASALGVGSPF